MARLVALVALIACTAAGAGCGDHCAQVGRHRQRFLDRQGEGEAPHLVATVPFAALNRVVEPAVRRLEGRPVELAGAGLLGAALQGATARVDRVVLGPGPADRLGVAVEVGVEVGGSRLLSLTVDAPFLAEIDPSGHRLVARLDAAGLEAASPALDPDAAGRLAGALRAVVPPFARMMVTDAAVEAIAGSMVSTFVAHSWPLLRGWVAASIEPLARFELSFPELPLARIGLESTRGAPDEGLRIFVWTRLPVRGAEAVEAPALGPGVGESELLLALPGATVAELGNWAMAAGRLDRRYDREGRPDARGELEAGFGWRGGERPLVVDLWGSGSPCLRARLSATPRVVVSDRGVVLEVDDGRLEEMDGPVSHRIGARLTGLWSRAFEASQTMAGSMALSVAGTPLTAEVRAIEAAAAGFEARVALIPGG